MVPAATRPAAAPAGDTAAVLPRPHEHLIDEHAEGERIDAETEIAYARQAGVRADATPAQPGLFKNQNPGRGPGFWQYRYRDSNPGYRRERAAS